LPCNCCTSRKSAPRSRKPATTTSAIRQPATHPSTDISPLPATHSPRTPSHILARLAELRPVLPRPADGHPSSGFTHGHQPRHHSHENLLFSPYGRAYDLAHNDQIYDYSRNRSVPNIVTQNKLSTTTRPLPAEERTFRDQLRALEAAAVLSNRSAEETDTSTARPSFPSTCGCGDGCTCPGCRQHNGAAPSSSAFSSCTNPGVCNTCLDSTILSLPASLPPDSSLSIFDAYPAESIDEWIRQVSSLPRGSPSNVDGVSQQQEGVWDNYLSTIAEPAPNNDGRYRVQACCGVLCKCPPETCECDVGHEGGYDCRSEILRETLTPADMSMFATSGDRSMATNAFDNVRTSETVGEYDVGSVRSQSAGGVYSGAGSWSARNYLTAPDLSAPAPLTRSRSSSSSSSQSSPFDFASDSHNLADTMADPFSTQPFTSFSLPDLGASLQPNFPSEMRNMMTASPTRSLYGGENCCGNYPISNPDSDGYSAEFEVEEQTWDPRIPSQLQHPWPRTN